MQSASVGPVAAEDHADASIAIRSLRRDLNLAKDYFAFAATVRDRASRGDAEAQYVMAMALKYCDENYRRFFLKSDGAPRSLDEALLHWASRPAGYQLEIRTTYDRCHGFHEDSNSDAADVATTTDWPAWLAKAATQGLAAAQAEQADIERIAAMQSQVSGKPENASHDESQVDPRHIAIAAAQSGDPDAIAKMANWIDGSAHSKDEYEVLVTAWQLLACQRGYDCSAESDLVRGVCVWNLQCVEGQSLQDVYKQQLGAQFDAALKLAGTIGAAIDAKDVSRLQSFL